MNSFGMVRVSCVTPVVKVGDPIQNRINIVSAIKSVDADIILLPELSITGYTSKDLLLQPILLNSSIEQVCNLAKEVNQDQVVVVGLPLAVNNSLYNCAAVMYSGKIAGFIPKQNLPNYKEFEEARWFSPANGSEQKYINIPFDRNDIPFGIDLLFKFRKTDVVFSCEICEDLWMAIPPSSKQAEAGSLILLNLSASNETVGKSRYRKELVNNQSGRCMSAYAYCSCGPTESTDDVVFGGHNIIAENGSILAEQQKFLRGANGICVDIDVEKLLYERRKTNTFYSKLSNFRVIDINKENWKVNGLKRVVTAKPFVPDNGLELENRCEEIFGIQCAGLAKRISRFNFNESANKVKLDKPLVIGVSGGLDSTLALLVAVKTCDMLSIDRKSILGVTMPGFGTTEKTLKNAVDLMNHLGISQMKCDIRKTCMEVFHSVGIKPFGFDRFKTDLISTSPVDVNEFIKFISNLPENSKDLQFENVQARVRTLFLMSLGFVIGTGDMSELALGWCTYNGDHMSMYNPNCSIPKTLVKFLVKYIAETEFNNDLTVKETLLSIVNTVISPELLPAKNGEIAQSTEESVGPYELNDFFLAGLLRNGWTPEKTLWMASFAKFEKDYTADEIKKWLKLFYDRFFTAQFKRNCVPNGPKVGSVSLSPRGDWRMPSDASVNLWLSSFKD